MLLNMEIPGNSRKRLAGHVPQHPASLRLLVLCTSTELHNWLPEFLCAHLFLQIILKYSLHSFKGLEAVSSGHLTANYKKCCMFSFFKFVK